MDNDRIKPDAATEASPPRSPTSPSDYDEGMNRPRRPAVHQHRSESEDRPPHRERLREGAFDPPKHMMGYGPRRSRSNSPRSEFSAYSYRTQAPLASTPWFFESWNVRAARGLDLQDIGSKQASSASPTIVTELSSASLQHAEAEPAASSAVHRIRSRTFNQSVPSVKPTLKRVVHATYGDLLQSEALKGANPPGFVAVSQSCGSQGDTLFHIL